MGTVRALVVLLALSLQAFLVQTHVHTALPQPALLAQAASPPKPAPAKPEPASACPLCATLSVAGHALLPTPANALPAAMAWLVHTPAPGIFAAPPAAISHIWRSRGPPLFG